MAEVNELCVKAVGVQPSSVELTPRLGGKVASIAFRVLVGSPTSLTELRESLRVDPRVRMVF